MRAQRRATRHDASQHDARKERETRHVICPHRTFPRFPLRRGGVRLSLLGQEGVFLLDPAPLLPICLRGFLRVLFCGGPFVVVEEQYASQRPVRGARPVGEEDEEADGEDVVA